MTEKDYVLGTDAEEISRLGLQHRVWRPRALDAWMRAGFRAGQVILDLGAGPGYAALDLAEIVGPTGKVVALERSRRFLDALEASRSRRSVLNIEAVEMDLDELKADLPESDGAWARWIFAFVKQPRRLLETIMRTLKPGAPFVIHEYLDYSAWRMMPRSLIFEEFVQEVMASWRADGGEPDIALELPAWLAGLGFHIKAMNPIVEVISPNSFAWEWPSAFVQSGLRRLVEIGRVTSVRAEEVRKAFAASAGTPNALMVTPIVLEIIAEKGNNR